MTHPDDSPAARRTMPETGIARAVVTDHAVLRYLERVHGLDVDYFRGVIADQVADGVRYGASAVQVDGVKFVLVGARVVTVVEGNGFVNPFHAVRKSEGT